MKYEITANVTLPSTIKVLRLAVAADSESAAKDSFSQKVHKKFPDCSKIEFSRIDKF